MPNQDWPNQDGQHPDEPNPGEPNPDRPDNAEPSKPMWKDLGTTFPTFKPLYKIAGGVKAYKKRIFASVHGDSIKDETRRFELSRQGLGELIGWLAEAGVEKAAVEGSGGHWRKVSGLLRQAGVDAMVVDPRDIRNWERPKDAAMDSLIWAWRTRLGHVDDQLEENDWDLGRGVSKARSMLARELKGHKEKVRELLHDAGFDLAEVVGDLFSRSGRIVLDGVMAGQDPFEILEKAAGCAGFHPKSTPETMLDALVGGMTDNLRWLLDQELEIIEFLGRRMVACERRAAKMRPRRPRGEPAP